MSSLINCYYYLAYGDTVIALRCFQQDYDSDFWVLFRSVMRDGCHGCCAGCIPALSKVLGPLPCRMESHRSSAHASPQIFLSGISVSLPSPGLNVISVCVSTWEVGSLEGFLSSLVSVFPLTCCLPPPPPPRVPLFPLSSDLVLKSKNILPYRESKCLSLLLAQPLLC